MNGQYAQIGTNNWPAQLQTCGNPPGSGVCSSIAYNPALPVLSPDSVTFNG